MEEYNFAGIVEVSYLGRNYGRKSGRESGQSNGRRGKDSTAGEDSGMIIVTEKDERIVDKYRKGRHINR